MTSRRDATARFTRRVCFVKQRARRHLIACGTSRLRESFVRRRNRSHPSPLIIRARVNDDPARSRFPRSGFVWAGATPIVAAVAVTLFFVVAAPISTASASGVHSATAPIQLGKLISRSAKITTLDFAVLAQVPSLSEAQLWTQFGSRGANGCDARTLCVYGDTTSSTTVVLFGDSHAAMWLPAVNPWAITHHVRLILVWHGGCPTATLPTNWLWQDPTGSTSNTWCVKWRNAAIEFVDSIHAKLILFAERTSAIVSVPSDQPFSSTQWKEADITTIDRLESTGSRVAMIEDVPWHPEGVPKCLLAHWSDVQACSVPYPPVQWPGQQIAEADAARQTKAGFIRTIGWFCTSDDKTCPGLVGNHIVYWDNGHLTDHYSSYLSGVMGTAITQVGA